LNGGATQSSNQFDSLTIGIYTITVIDANNCSVTGTTELITPLLPSVNIQVIDSISCFNASNGSVVAIVSGVNPPYSFTWNTAPISTNDTLTNMDTSIYIVTIVDALGCNASSSISLTQPSPVNVIINSVSNPTIFGLANGSVTSTATGGTPNYTYTLFDSLNNQLGVNSTGAFNALLAGTYYILATDINGCIDTESFILLQPLPLTIVLIDTINLLCNNDNNGQAILYVSGGTKPYIISSMPNLSFVANNDTLLFSGLSAGTYTVNVVDNAGATTTISFTITEPSQLIIDSLFTLNPFCNPNDNGVIEIFTSGGTLNYNYQLQGTNGIILNQSTNIFSSLIAQNYTVTVIDANGCSFNSQTQLIIPSSPIITSVLTTEEWCNPNANASMIINANGGNGNLQFGIDLNNLASNNTFAGLNAGTYTAYVIDTLGCIDSSLATINHVPLITGIVVDTTQASCLPGNDGSIAINISGGSAPFTYVINGIAQNSNFANGLAIGNYTVEVIDIYGCTISDTVLITTPGDPQFTSVNVNSPTCFGFNNGAIVIGPVISVSTVTFTLNPFNVTNTSGNFSGVPADTYTISIQDAVGCTNSTIVTVTEPTALVIDSINSIPVLCFGDLNGIVSIYASGGTPNYSYQLNSGALSSINSFSGLAAGIYTITVSDNQACTISNTVSIATPAPFEVQFTSVNSVTCSGLTNGSISVIGVGGTPIYTFTLNNILTNSSGNFLLLPPGGYTVNAIDNNGCTSSISTIILSPPPIQIDSVWLIQPLCFGDSNGIIGIAAQGGTGGLQYSLDSVLWNVTPIFIGLASSTYVLYIQDQNGCTIDTSVNLSQPTPVVYDSITINHLLCYQDQTGAISANASGGIPGYSYSLLPLALTNLTGDFNNLSAGTYTIIVEDANFCSVAASLSITEPTPLDFANILSNDLKCFNGFDGVISALGTGGTFPYTFTLNPGGVSVTNGLFIGLAADTYTLTLSDANGCSVSTIITLTQPPPIVINSIALTHIKCYGDFSGAIVASASGGTGTLIYQLVNFTLPNTSGVFNQLQAGTYTLQVRDANLCTINSALTLTQNPQIQLDSVALNMPLCYGQANGSIYASAQGGLGLLTYQFNGQNYINYIWHTGLAAGNYPVRITDSIGCIVDTFLNLPEPGPLYLSATEIDNNSCLGNKNGSAEFIPSGGTAPYLYVITPIFTVTNNDTVPYLGSGNYTVTVIDANKCMFTTTFVITTDTNAVSFTADIIGETCEGIGNNGSITINATGGTIPYQYSWNLGPKTNLNVRNDLSWGDYIITVVDNKGCTFTDTLAVPVAPCCEVFLPNVFTPNGDDINDVYRPITGAGYQIKTFIIYDRWGNQVFATNELGKGWDGTYKGLPMNMDTYYVLFIYKCFFDNKTYVLKQDITLLHN
jgi:gliding motility-associated-like protein